MRMTKKIPLIILVGILGFISAGAMWYMTSSGAMTPMMGTTYVSDVMMGRAEGGMGSAGMVAPSILPGEDAFYGKTTTSMYYPYPGSDDALTVQDRSVQKFASHSLVVTDVDQYVRTLKEYFQNNGGIVLSFSQGSQNDYTYANMTVKVPLYKFDEAVSKVKENVKKVVFANEDSQDITGQVVSIDNQLQTLQDNKAKQEISLEEATTATDKRRIQLEIDRLTRQIEQLQQSQQIVEDRVDYATLNISVANREYYFNGEGPRPVQDVLREAWRSLSGTGFGILYFLIWVVVYAIIWVPVLLLARWIW